MTFPHVWTSFMKAHLCDKESMKKEQGANVACSALVSAPAVGVGGNYPRKRSSYSSSLLRHCRSKRTVSCSPMAQIFQRSNQYFWSCWMAERPSWEVSLILCCVFGQLAGLHAQCVWHTSTRKWCSSNWVAQYTMYCASDTSLPDLFRSSTIVN